MAVRVALRMLLALAALAAVEGQSGSTYRTAEDFQASQEAQTAVAEDCADVDLDGIDRQGGREALRDYMGSEANIILTILRESQNSEQLSQKAQDQLSPTWLIKTAGAMVFSFILIFVYLVCCWTACPCCKCCLCCRRQHKCSKIVKIVLMAILGGLLFGMVVSAMLALQGKSQIEGGMDSVSCTAASTMYHTLEGKPAERFVGILPMLDELGSIRGSLSDGSGLLSDVQTIMQNTQDLERSQFVAAQALLLFQETLELPENRNQPATQSAISQILPPIRGVNDALSTGLGSALTSARAEVDNQLSSSNRDSLRDAVDSAVEPLRSAADTVRDSLWFFIKDGFRDIKGIAIQATSGGVISVACIIFLLAACGICSGLLCTFREYSEEQDKVGNNPWNKNVSRCSLTTWCCGFIYAFLVFFFGGLMVICAVPMASTCLIMDDINSQMIRDILPALGGSAPGDSFNMVADIIDQCFSRSHTGPDQSLMDIVYFEEGGIRTSLSEKLMGQMVDPMNAKFDDITQQLSSGSANLATDPGVVQLKSELQSFSWPTGAPVTTGYRCDIFQTSLGFNCDVKDMTGNSNDCVTGTNPLAMTRKSVTCTSSQFVTYMNQWATRIDKVFTRLDSSVTATGTEISTDLKNSVNTHITDPITNIITQAHCTFLRQEFHDFVGGFCFQGVVGFGSVARAYVANGVLTLLLIIVAYVVWRISVDNQYSWNDEVKPMEHQVHPAP